MRSPRVAEAMKKGPLIFNESIRGTLGDADRGKVVVIDIDSGDYEIDYDDAAALFRLLERRPDAYDLVGVVVGFDAVHFIGFQPVLVTTLESDSTPLLGMALMWGSRLTADARQGGEVLIEGMSDTDAG